jgi:light-regulated signal transduction histidine kinase (bacteriophytochrome)
VKGDLDDFAYIASHDLKEPLRGISAYCEILLEDYHDKLDQEGQRRLLAILGMSTRLGALIDNLLTYCQIGRVPTERAEIELSEVVQQALDTLRPMIEKQRGLVRVSGRLPKANADAGLLGMVFGNLIVNGLKFNESRRPCVEIGTLKGNPAVICVRDNGIGIPYEHHEAVFTLFRRLHSRKKYDGTGAGLTIVRKIVESYGGKIWLESEPGRGSTFLFTLGAAIGPQPAGGAPGAKPPHWVGQHQAVALGSVSLQD